MVAVFQTDWCKSSVRASFLGSFSHFPYGWGRPQVQASPMQKLRSKEEAQRKLSCESPVLSLSEGLSKDIASGLTDQRKSCGSNVNTDNQERMRMLWLEQNDSCSSEPPSDSHQDKGADPQLITATTGDVSGCHSLEGRGWKGVLLESRNRGHVWVLQCTGQSQPRTVWPRTSVVIKLRSPAQDFIHLPWLVCLLLREQNEGSISNKSIVSPTREKNL